MTGDAKTAALKIADQLGIADVRSDLKPEDKVEHLTNLKNEGRRVLMIGDGLNDAAALNTAHVSIAPASALDCARAASDIVLLGDDLRPVISAMKTSRAARRRIIENFSIAIGYNLIAVPIALVGAATPLIAALAMSLSSISVSLNAIRGVRRLFFSCLCQLPYFFVLRVWPRFYGRYARANLKRRKGKAGAS